MLPRGLLKEYANALILLISLVDMTLVFIAGWVAYLCKFNTYTLPYSYLSGMLIGFFLTPIIFSFFSIYLPMRGRGLFNHFICLIQAMCFLMLCLAGLAFLTKSGENFSRAWFMVWMSTSLILLIFFRFSVLSFLRYMRSCGMNERRVIIIGAGDIGIKLVENVQQALWTGFRIVCLMDDHIDDKPKEIHHIPIIQTPSDMSQYFSRKDIDEVWIALPLQANLRVKTILHELRYQTFTMRFVLDVYGLDLLHHQVTGLAGLPVINICSTPMLGVNRFIKALEDRILAVIILILTGPLLLLISLAIYLTSPGPIFYRQKRISWNGIEFEMLKFRSMPVNAEKKTGPVWTTPEDNRATPLGKWLRRTSLDELPQFINVLKGEMSIVGPRPERKIFVDEFKEKIPRYMQKHLVKAGITGWAQVNGWRGNTSIEKRIEYDLFYVENWSLKFDLKIILLTIVRGFVNRNAY
jgi:putative colanic acid biosynthesis UDP-glucose lipid carrier transferase